MSDPHTIRLLATDFLGRKRKYDFSSSATPEALEAQKEIAKADLKADLKAERKNINAAKQERLLNRLSAPAFDTLIKWRSDKADRRRARKAEQSKTRQGDTDALLALAADALLELADG